MATGKFRASAALLFPLLFAVGSTRAQDPLPTLPKNYRLLFENGCIRVIRVNYAPLEKLPVHDHPDRPTVYVYLNDSGPVRFSHVEEDPFSLVRPAERLGRSDTVLGVSKSTRLRISGTFRLSSCVWS
jgi:hypothetical protein